MKRIINIILIISMVVSLVPMAVAVVAAETKESSIGNMQDWTAGEGWTYDSSAGTLVQNTINPNWCAWNSTFSGEKEFTFSTAIKFTTNIESVGSFGDATAGYLYDPDRNLHGKFVLATYRPTDTNYQLAVGWEFFDGANWSSTIWYWSDMYEAPITEAVFSMQVVPAEKKILWAANTNSGTAMVSGTVDDSMMPAGYLPATNLRILLGSNNYGKVVYSQMNLTYKEVQETPIGNMTDWTAGEGWTYDPSTGTLVQNTINPNWCAWNTNFSGEKEFTFSTAIKFTTNIESVGSFGDAAAGYLYDPDRNLTGKFVLATYRPTDTNYQLAVGWQSFDGANWSDTIWYWSDMYEAPVKEAVFSVRVVPAENKIIWAARTNSGTTMVSGTTDNSVLPAGYLPATNLQILLGSNNFGKVVYSQMNIEIVEEKPPVTGDDFFFAVVSVIALSGLAVAALIIPRKRYFGAE